MLSISKRRVFGCRGEKYPIANPNSEELEPSTATSVTVLENEPVLDTEICGLEKGTLAAALYSNAGRLLEVKCSAIDGGNISTHMCRYTDAAEVRVFALDSVAALEPLTESEKLVLALYIIKNE